MHLVDGSVTVVLVGDWNKFYIKPDWVAGNSIICMFKRRRGNSAALNRLLIFN